MKPLKESILILSALIFTYSITAQDDINIYKPPNVMKGFDLTLVSSPAISLYKYYNESPENSYHADVNANIDNWKFTEKFLYAFYSNIRASASNVVYSDIPKTKGYNAENSTVDLNFEFNLSGGASYYILSSDFYANLYLQSDNVFNSHYIPDFSFSCYPGIGYGRMYDASRVKQMENFEKVLIDEKIIKSPLKKSARKRLVEMLDKRNDRDFISMFKDDNEIEFYSRVEDMLKEEKIIQDNLGSKEILKMFQALTNESYVYFPVFKGFLVQAESKIYTLYESACGPSGCSRQYSFHPFNSLMFSGIYGLPVNNKLSLVGSIYSTFPVTNKYLNDYIYYDFNSPVTLIDRNSIDPNYSGIFDQYNSNYNEIALKMNLGLNLNGFYSFNTFCGTSARIYANVKLNDFPGKDEIDGGINTNFDFNILNHLNLRLYFDYRVYSNVDHYYIIGTDVLYRVF